MKTRTIKHSLAGPDVRVPIDCENTIEVAAGILARRMYGHRKGVVRALRFETWSQRDDSYVHQAFIGRANKDGSCTGRNVWIYS